MVKDTKLVAETVVTKEQGEHGSVVMRWHLHFGQRLSDFFGVGQGTTSAVKDSLDSRAHYQTVQMRLTEAQRRSDQFQIELRGKQTNKAVRVSSSAVLVGVQEPSQHGQPSQPSQPIQPNSLVGPRRRVGLVGPTGTLK
jgi:hypothetical protein